MLKYQVRTLGRERRRQSTTPLRDVFTTTTVSANSDTITANGSKQSVSAPTSPWHDLSRTRGRSTSVSSLSSASTSSESGQEWSTIRVYTSTVRPDTDYKTLFANANTTCAELIRLVLNKFRIHFKDPELFYLTMELTTKHEANEVRHAVALDSGAKPLVLQACYPAERCRFVLNIRQSFPVRIYDSSFCTTSNYKTLMVSQRTTASEAVRMVMKSRNDASGSPSISYEDNNSDNDDDAETRRNEFADFAISLIDVRTRKENLLRPDDSLFTALYETGANAQYQLHLRPLRRRRRFEQAQQLMPEPDDDEQVSANYYRRRKVTPAATPSYADDDFAISRLTSRFRDHVL